MSSIKSKFAKGLIEQAKADNNTKTKTEISKMSSAIYEWVEAAIYSLICVVLAFIFIFRIVGVDGDSMVPTLYDKERLVLLTFLYQPQHGDIIVINRYTQDPLVKRVIAVGGDRIAILPDTGEVVLNGVILNENYTQGKTVLREFGSETKEVPKGYLVVMGDNREISKDSRSAEVGFINIKDVVGKAIFRFYPSRKLGFLN
ncbi:MAG TPA: signal peptidase I [Ruminococcaceae bacterium]|nr:signal peptidase I [Oscillospiraceae bacterium]